MALAAAGLKTHIWNNNLRSIILLVGYPFLMGAIVWAMAAAIGFFMGQSAGPNAPHGTIATNFANGFIAQYWPLIGTAVAIWFIIAWFFNTRMVRMLSHAKPVTRAEEPALYNLLENLCIARGLPMPHLNIIETDALNAFASGVQRSDYTVTVTRGLLNTLRPDEVEGVLAHELTHIINHDVRLLMVCIIFTGMIGFAMQLVWSSVRYGLYMPRSGNNRNNGGTIIIALAILLILAIGYGASLLTRFALSRRREYMADAGAVELTRNPDAMMRALQRISGRDHIPAVPDDVALMCIENGHAFMGLFATHPSIDDRIRALSTMTGTPIPGAYGTQKSDNPLNPWAR